MVNVGGELHRKLEKPIERRRALRDSGERTREVRLERRVGKMAETARPATWRKVLAGILDFLTIFIAGGYVIAKLTGNTTEGGFSLSGLSALALFALIFAYFWIGSRYAGGTLWQRILRSRG